MQRLTFDTLINAANARGLLCMGALHPRPGEIATGTDVGGTLVLIGAGADFWPVFRAAPEASDGLPDPIDRWSERVVGEFAQEFGAVAHFPFGGPPYSPFIDWAKRSGRAFSSPTGMLVHDSVGLMISYRGALHVPDLLDIPPTIATSPCDSCDDQPCVTACPVGALGASAPYDLVACHAYLDVAAGRECMSAGCHVRRACPVSAGAARTHDQSAHHMKAFHPS